MEKFDNALLPIISGAMKVPGVQVDREDFLRKELKGKVPDEIIENAVNNGISLMQLNDKWKVDDSVTVIYSQQEPKNSCLEKEDLIAAIALTIFSLILLIGAIVVECYALMAV